MFFKVFEDLLVNFNPVTPIGRQIFYIDGGFLLHKVLWPPLSTLKSTINMKDTYRGSHVIFHGYSDRLSTKQQGQNRRAGATPCADVLFECFTIKVFVKYQK